MNQPGPAGQSTAGARLAGRPQARRALPADPPPADPVLYAMACGSPVAGHVHELVAAAQRAGWHVRVIATPQGRAFLDVAALAAQTGHEVRSDFCHAAEGETLPAADAIVVAPATVNTVNKWAHGIADTLVLALLIEAYGMGVPVVVVPYTNAAMAVHPAFQQSLHTLRSWGVRVLFGEDVVAMPQKGEAARRAAEFPWHLALAALGPPGRAHRTPPARRGMARRRPPAPPARPPPPPRHGGAP